jgi:hypothetical protein
MAARTGKIVWRYRAGVFESSPLVVGKTLYVGSWDHKLHAVNIYTGKARWTFTADGEINSSPAFVNGKVYFGTDGGSVYALDARTGRLRWRARALSRFGRREFFYATPTIAYGRVYIGNTDGTLYAFGASADGCCGPSAPAPSTRRLRSGGNRLHRYVRRSVHGVQCGDRGPAWRQARPRSTARRASSTVRLLRRSFARPQRLPVVQERRPRPTLNALTGKLVCTGPTASSVRHADSQHLYIVGARACSALH